MQAIFAHTALLPVGWQDNVATTVDAGGRFAGVSPCRYAVKDCRRIRRKTIVPRFAFAKNRLLERP